MKILVIQQKMIGDVLVSSLICENLKLNYPKAEIHYLVNRFTIPVIENNPYINKIVIFEDEYRSSKLKFYKFLKQINKAKYDVVIDAYGKLESNLITLFSGAKTKIGWNKPLTNLIYSSTVKISNQSKIGLGSAIENRLNLMSALKGSKILTRLPKIHLKPDELDNAKNKIQEFQKTKPVTFIMISALGSSEAKTYPLRFMAKVLDFIALNSNALLIMNYMPSQFEDIKKLYFLCDKNTQGKILLNFKIESLRELMSVSKFCKALIGNEGGAINMAKALDVPTFSIFSPQINKEGWNGFEDENLNHVSVHVKDYKPNLFLEKSRTDYMEMYEEFSPSLYLESLKTFLIKHVN